MSPGTLSHGMVYGVVHRTDNNHKREMVVYGWSADQLKEEMNYIKEVSYSFSFKICQISLPFIHVELWVTIGQPTSRPTSKFESGTHFEVKCLPCWYSSLKNKTKQKHPLGTWELHVSNSSPLWQMICSMTEVRDAPGTWTSNLPNRFRGPWPEVFIIFNVIQENLCT